MSGTKKSALPTTYNGQHNTWSGDDLVEFYGTEVSVGKIMFDTMKNWPSNVCQINDDDGISVTNGQAITWAIRIAQHLKSKGLDHTHFVGIVAVNCTYLMPLGVASLLNGTPFHPVNALQGKDILKHAFEITKPKIIFCNGREYELVKSATLDWQPEMYTLTDPIEGVPKVEDLLEATETELYYQPEPLRCGPNQTVAILCSSGTTGLPKAVCISKYVLTQKITAFNSETVLFISSALDWITGLCGFCACTIFGCTRIITGRSFTPEHFIQLVEKYKINSVILQPRFLSVVVTCPDATPESLSSLRMLMYGGGATSLSTLKRAQTVCQNAVLNCIYATTELAAVASNIGNEDDLNAAGRVLPGRKIRIVDDEGVSLGHNQIGEIYVSTGQVWNGYYGNPSETRNTQDSEGWFHTGDLGYFNDQNFLYIVGRKKETLKYRGLHFSPAEIESVIAEIPQVQDVCVVGVYNERHGDEAGALIVLREGCELGEKQIVDHVSKRLTTAHMQLHSGVRFANKLPTNSNGKILRREASKTFVSL